MLRHYRLGAFGLVVLVVGVGLFAWGPVQQFVSIVSASAACVGLLALLVQVLLGAAEHHKAILLQDRQNHFIVGASSHMANVAFDKHVQFAEEYVDEYHKALETLTREGPVANVLSHAAILVRLRVTFAIWITDELEAALKPFEQGLRDIGAKAYLADALRSEGDTARDRRLKAIEELFQEFAKVIGLSEWDGQPVSEELRVAAVIGKLRTVLGVTELTSLRAGILHNAALQLQNTTSTENIRGAKTRALVKGPH
ncbi:hypothetical protein [Pseudomonas tohonis]|uniref:hypothetical protein n=1 Tax=Pseudomonas tohonis TaxID=2725477 RepID=UPI00255B629D|nr:hypothetical protein [Pseudomonas tohonis]